ncbi:NAD-dependent epimerase/dehydratase family protein [Agriterribacter sp.]|uniref:NAD-dependent epimerase/dehydratase family protein n=1 Tax=Agriterribacter sp. TaxID=2821509 RepID=UPI002B5754E5|nr:NAD-dependent epimerase/dehydratase family protein [Agriterribacter sp.]HTN06581.1 NAD-dependent epimerase/dehydratase family protein [Agriterribacter sp.]
MTTIETAYQQLLQPSAVLAEDIIKIQGDIMILGAGGKMGPALAKLARQAINKAGISKKVTAVSRFSEPGVQQDLEKAGVMTLNADLLEDDQLQALPPAENVLYLAGTKFGTTGKEYATWAMNAYLPGRVAEKYTASRIVVFSTGNVYPLVPVSSGGATEQTAPEPVGEYAQSCLGRERLFQYQSSKHNTPLFIYRLNYANDVSYGVLLEIARCVMENKAIDLSMGHINAIWQGDANEMAIRALLYCETPAKTVNITGPETISVRWAAGEFGKMFNQTPVFVNEAQPTALLSNAAEACCLFGYPKVSLMQMMKLQAEWLKQGGKTISKPTHYQERKGKF